MKLQRRRNLQFLMSLGVCSIFSPLANTASANPLLLLANVVFRVFLGNTVRFVASRAIPSLVATPLRRFLLSVALGYGFAATEAEAVAAKAESLGAETILRAGLKNDILIEIQNVNSQPVQISNAVAQIINLESDQVEDQIELPLVFIRANKTKTVPFTIERFKQPGLKVLRIVHNGQTYAESKRLYATT